MDFSMLGLDLTQKSFMVFVWPKLYLCKKSHPKPYVSQNEIDLDELRCVLCMDQLLHELFTTSFL